MKHLLHICAEYYHLNCAKTLVKHGADVNSKAGIDSNGFGGQTPVFHTVNQHNNTCYPCDEFSCLVAYLKRSYLENWIKGYAWETFIPCINPISYAMMGLLRQFQRTEIDIYEVVEVLMKTAHGIEYEPVNIPNST